MRAKLARPSLEDLLAEVGEPAPGSTKLSDVSDLALGKVADLAKRRAASLRGREADAYTILERTLRRLLAAKRRAGIHTVQKPS